MFCKIKINRYFATFMNDNNVIMIFNIGWIPALNQLLCKILFSDKLMISSSLVVWYSEVKACYFVAHLAANWRRSSCRGAARRRWRRGGGSEGGQKQGASSSSWGKSEGNLKTKSIEGAACLFVVWIALQYCPNIHELGDGNAIFQAWLSIRLTVIAFTFLQYLIATNPFKFSED